MLERGAFAGVHAAMMVHPWPTERLTGTCLAVAHFDVHYTGREAHASAAPWEGRQRAGRPDGRPGGDRPAAPAAAPGRPGPRRGHPELGGGQRHPRRRSRPATWSARAPPTGLAALRPRVDACFEAGALATGCTARLRGAVAGVLAHGGGPGPAAAPTGPTPRRSAGASTPTTPGRRCPTFSTDMANVSLAVPTIHPLIGIETHGAVNHQREFAAACVTPSADAAVRDGAVALAWTAIDAATDPALRGTAARRVITEHALLDVVPGREDEFVAAMERAKAHHRRQPGLRLAAGRALRGAPELLPAPGRVGAPGGPHRGLPGLGRPTRSGGPPCTTSTTRSPWWSTSRRSSPPEPVWCDPGEGPGANLNLWALQRARRHRQRRESQSWTTVYGDPQLGQVRLERLLGVGTGTGLGVGEHGRRPLPCPGPVRRRARPGPWAGQPRGAMAPSTG